MSAWKYRETKQNHDVFLQNTKGEGRLLEKKWQLMSTITDLFKTTDKFNIRREDNFTKSMLPLPFYEM